VTSIEAQRPNDVPVRSRASPAGTWALALSILISMLCLAGPAPALPLTTPLNPQSFKTIQGEILKIEGELYVIRPVSPIAGKEIRLRVDDKTVRVDADSFKVGDVIIADVTPEGRALTITTLPPERDARP